MCSVYNSLIFLFSNPIESEVTDILSVTCTDGSANGARCGKVELVTTTHVSPFTPQCTLKGMSEEETGSEE